MGGVDRQDQNVGLYRCGINSKKWWWPILLYLIDMCVQQTWQLYRRLYESAIFPKDQLAVRREIANIWLKQAPVNSRTGRKGGKYAALDKRVPPHVRFDGNSHFIEKKKKQKNRLGALLVTWNAVNAVSNVKLVCMIAALFISILSEWICPYVKHVSHFDNRNDQFMWFVIFFLLFPLFFFFFFFTRCICIYTSILYNKWRKSQCKAFVTHPYYLSYVSSCLLYLYCAFCNISQQQNNIPRVHEGS